MPKKHRVRLLGSIGKAITLEKAQNVLIPSTPIPPSQNLIFQWPNLDQLARLDCCGPIVRDCTLDGEEGTTWEPVDPEYIFAVFPDNGIWDVPAYFADIPEYTRFIDVLLVGGGGSAGSEGAGTNTRGSGGGGAGQVGVVNLQDVAGQTIAVTIGVGGTGLGNGNPNPNPPGGGTGVLLTDGRFISAGGGGGGQRYIAGDSTPNNVRAPTGGGAGDGGSGGGACGLYPGDGNTLLPSDPSMHIGGGGVTLGGSVADFDTAGAAGGGGGSSANGESPTPLSKVGRGGAGTLLVDLLGPSYNEWLVSRGTWITPRDYQKGDLVSKLIGVGNAGFYIAQQDNNGVDPETQPSSVWRRIIQDQNTTSWLPDRQAVGGGGAGGQSLTTPSPTGGLGGGGEGAVGAGSGGDNGYPNTGGGAGGSLSGKFNTGGSGLVIIRYLSEESANAQPVPVLTNPGSVGWRCYELVTVGGTETELDFGVSNHTNGRLVINNIAAQNGGNPEFDLALVEQGVGGMPQALTVDAWGRVIESRPLVAQDIEDLGIASTSRFPLVTGEVPPRFVYLEDGSLVYIEV